MTDYKSTRIIDGKPRQVVIDENGEIINRNPNMNKGFEHFPDDCLDYINHPSHAKPGIHTLHNKLYVVSVVFNPLRFRNRYWNYWTFNSMCEKAGAILYTAEIAFGEREYEITSPDNPRHLQLRARDSQEIWLKENALNLIINRLPPEAKYIAWLDTDISFARTDWAQETLHELQRYDFLQLFSHAQDVGPNYEPLTITPGFVYSKFEEQLGDFNSNSSQNQNSNVNSQDTEAKKAIKGLGLNKCMEECLEEAFEECLEECHYYYGAIRMGKEGKPLWKFYHSGFAWAARRESLSKVGGLIDYCLLGSGDWHQAHGLFGQMKKTLNVGYSDTYKRLCLEWERRAEKNIRRNVGYIPGLINHHWHGKKSNRRYDDRWRLLADTKYDPISDLRKDVQGLYQLDDNGDPRFLALRDGLRRYAKVRDEDNPNL